MKKNNLLNIEKIQNEKKRFIVIMRSYYFKNNDNDLKTSFDEEYKYILKNQFLSYNLLQKANSNKNLL